MKRHNFIKTMDITSTFTFSEVGNSLTSPFYSLSNTNNSYQSLPLWKGFNLLNKFKSKTVFN